MEFTAETIEALKAAYRRERRLNADAPVGYTIGAGDIYLFTIPPEPLVLTFDRLDGGQLVALHTHDGRSVAAIVHPATDSGWGELGSRRWCLAGDIGDHPRPQGAHERVAVACAEAAAALGVELGVDVAGYEVSR